MSGCCLTTEEAVFLATHWRERITFRWDYEDACFLHNRLKGFVGFDFYTASSLKQRSIGRHALQFDTYPDSRQTRFQPLLLQTCLCSYLTEQSSSEARFKHFYHTTTNNYTDNIVYKLCLALYSYNVNLIWCPPIQRAAKIGRIVYWTW